MEISKQSGVKINPRVTRRDLLIGGTAGAGIAAGLGSLYRSSSAPAEDSVERKVPFYGAYQAGIITPAPANALTVAFDTTARNKGELMRLFKTLTQRIEFLMAGGTPPARDPKFPASDSGILGPEVVPDNLTITVAVGDSLFDARYGLGNLKPKRLTEMPGFPNDQLDPGLCHGDLMLQFCANTAETNLHGLRDIIKNLSDLITLRWKMEGFQKPNTATKPHTTSTRNLLGFKDGTANLDANNSTLMNQLVWVQPRSDEPAWVVGGSYQVVRVVRNLVERWDRTPLQEQETIIGRSRDTGAPLGMRHEDEVPNYIEDPAGKKLPMDAHIRLANPRTKETEENLILRRGFNYSRSFDKAGHLDMGLLFICFQADLKKGFVTVQNRLNGESLEEYIKPIGGGYFFALPGVAAKGKYLGQSLLEA